MQRVGPAYPFERFQAVLTKPKKKSGANQQRVLVCKTVMLVECEVALVMARKGPAAMLAKFWLGADHVVPGFEFPMPNGEKYQQ